MVKRTLSAAVLAAVMLLSSCTFPPEFVSPWENAKKIEEVMESIKNGEREELAEYFSEYLKTEHYDELIEEIDEMYEFIGGEIVSYDAPGYVGYNRKTVHSGDITLFISNPEVEDVEISDGKTLMFYFSYTVVNDEIPENVGINQIIAGYKNRKENDEKVKVNGNTEYGMKEKDKE